MDKILSGRQTDIFIVCNENYPLMSLSVGIFFGFYSILPAMNTAWWPVFQELNEGKGGENVVGQNPCFVFTFCVLCF